METIELPRIAAREGLDPGQKVGPLLPRTETFTPNAGEYSYRAAMGETTIADVVMRVSTNDKSLNLLIFTRSNDTLNKVFTVHYRGEGTLDSQSFRPKDSCIREQTGKRIKINRLTFEDELVHSIEFKKRPGKTDKKTLREFENDESIYDIFSAILILQSRQWSIDSTEILYIAIGKDRYLLTLHCEGKESISIGDTNPREAWRIGIKIEEIGDDETKGSTTTSIYISNDETRDILRIQIKSIFGTANIDLMSSPNSKPNLP